MVENQNPITAMEKHVTNHVNFGSSDLVTLFLFVARHKEVPS